jgi:hypothetical protein
LYPSDDGHYLIISVMKSTGTEFRVEPTNKSIEEAAEKWAFLVTVLNVKDGRLPVPRASRPRFE